MSAEYSKKTLVSCLKELHLSTLRSCFESEAELARKESIQYEHYLMLIAGIECQARRERRTQRFLNESHLPLEKNLNTFDFERLPRKTALQARALLDGAFLDRKENVLAFGNPGSGKTHLLCAISQELIMKGRRILFCSCSFLVQELMKAKSELKLERMLKKLSKYEALLLDDIGYVQQTREEMEVLFTLLACRYERASIMLTSNLPFSKWEGIFKDPMTTAAAIDRLVHHSVIIELNVKSYRLESAEKRKEAEPKKQ